MKNIITLILCLLLSASPELVKAQTCHAGTISASRETVCWGTSAILNISGSNGNIEWQSATNATFAFVPGGYDSSCTTGFLTQTTYFRVIVSNGSCKDTSAEIKISVAPQMVVGFKYTKTGTDMFSFDTTGNWKHAASYVWYFGDGDSSNAVMPVHYFDKDTSYSVCLIVRDSFECSYSSCALVPLQTGMLPCAAVFSFISSNDTVYFNSSGSYDYLSNNPFAWTFGDGSMGFGSNPVHVYNVLGNYNVCLSVPDPIGACNGNVCLNILAGPNAVIPVSANKQSLVIYPNPCSTCQIKGIENSTDIIVTDILGRIIPFSLTKSSNGYQLNLPGNRIGFFLVKNMKTGEVVKFVRE